MAADPPESRPSLGVRVMKFLLGAAKNPLDAAAFRRASLVAVLAWVGMGADGLSSSCYGPEHAYRALGPHTSLALPLAGFMMLAVFVISASYTQVIEQFASTGTGTGYFVATRFLSPWAGVISGSALVVDYILTIAISVASASDAAFSFLPIEYQPYKLWAALGMLLMLGVLNLRGLRESVMTLTPIFFAFVVTHAGVILWGLFAHGDTATDILVENSRATARLVDGVGIWGTLFILMKAFSLGGGTYTGIEAVSNCLPVLREPRAETGRKTMTYMSCSLAFTAGGLLLCYLFNDVRPVPGQTLNASLLHVLWDGWTVAGVDVGRILVIVTLMAEAALLVVAAQSGFIGGPQVLASMATDSWVPHRFANLSDRLVNQDGIVLMAGCAALILALTGAHVEVLVVMYSINVFITFSMTQLGMCRHWLEVRRLGQRWLKSLLENVTGLVLTVWILAFTIVIKFGDGGWVTLLMTGGFIGLCLFVKGHYLKVRRHLKRLDDLLTSLKFEAKRSRVRGKDPKAPTAVLMVTGYNGLGVHALFSVLRLFPDRFKNFVFVEVGTIDSSRFSGLDAIRNLEASVKRDLEKYVELAQRLGFYAEYRYALNVDRLEALEAQCAAISKEFKDAIYFVGKLVFERETWISHLLHSQTALSIQKKLIFQGHQAIVVPIRVHG